MTAGLPSRFGHRKHGGSRSLGKDEKAQFAPYGKPQSQTLLED